MSPAAHSDEGVIRVVQVTVQSDPNGVGGRRRASRCAAITRTRIPTPSRLQENRDSLERLMLV